MNKILKIMATTSAMLVATSCSNFLTKDPTTSTDATYFNIDKGNAVLAVNAIYDATAWMNEGITLPANSAFGWNLEWSYGDICSDDADPGSTTDDGQTIIFTAMREWRADPSVNAYKGMWVSMFVVINRANYVLTYIDDATLITAELRSRLKGEALFLRGYAYFNLVKIYGGVPLIDHLVTPDEYGTLKRASIAETYAFLEKDFKAAKDLLPGKNGYANEDAGRATSGAALGYLARAIMYQLGTSNSDENGHSWQNVYDYTNEVINSGQYSLLSNYAQIFTDEGENSSESSFEIQYLDNKAGDYDNSKGVGNGSVQVENPRSTWGWGFNTPTASLVAEYESGDPRLTSTVLQDGDILYGKKFAIDNGQDFNGRLNRKIAVAQQPSATWNGGVNERKMRYSDIILMNAEAAYYLGNEGDARTMVNLVRARAKASTLPKGSVLDDAGGYAPASVPNGSLDPLDGTFAGTDLRDAIWHERRCEFGMESLRFWDLVRTGKYLTSISSVASTNVTSHGLNAADGHFIPLFPLPPVDKSFNIENNPGY